MSLMKDYGSGAGIVKSVLSIHPYLYLDKERFFPQMSYENKRSFLKTELTDRPNEASLVDYMPDEQVDIALINEGIRRQMLNYETDRISNAQNEGSNLDGTNRIEEMEKQFRADLAEMKAAGASKVDMRAFIDDFEKKKEELLHPQVFNAESQKSWEDELREEMEAKDEEERKKAKEAESVEGEFDAPELDLKAIREASEQYRREQILISKRKFKRKMDGQDKFANGNSIVNELGEEESVETIALPDNAAEKQVKAMEKAANPVKRGRPKGSPNVKKKTTKSNLKKT